jgi:hypothetical protein
MRGRSLRFATLAVLVTALSGCGDGDGKTTAERADKAAKPPAGWRTVTNRTAGFTVSAPRSWTASEKAASTVLRSGDKQVVATVSADRSRFGRELPAEEYARQALSDLPEFEGSLSTKERPVRGSPYESSRVEGSGRFKASRRAQRITVAAFHRPDQVTYSVIVFRNAAIDPRVTDPTLAKLLRSLRARPPDSG